MEGIVTFLYAYNTADAHRMHALEGMRWCRQFFGFFSGLHSCVLPSCMLTSGCVLVAESLKIDGAACSACGHMVASLVLLQWVGDAAQRL
jgi:hypothetical protein